MNTVRLVALSTLVSFYSLHSAAVVQTLVMTGMVLSQSAIAAALLGTEATISQPNSNKTMYYHNQRVKPLKAQNHYSRHHSNASAKSHCKRGNYQHGKSTK